MKFSHQKRSSCSYSQLSVSKNSILYSIRFTLPIFHTESYLHPSAQFSQCDIPTVSFTQTLVHWIFSLIREDQQHVDTRQTAACPHAGRLEYVNISLMLHVQWNLYHLIWSTGLNDDNYVSSSLVKKKGTLIWSKSIMAILERNKTFIWFNGSLAFL